MTAVLLSDDSSGNYNYYSLQAAQGYLSWEWGVVTTPAKLYENPLSLWFQLPDGAHADDPLTTGLTIYVGANLPAQRWLWAETDSNVGWGAAGQDSIYEWQLFLSYENITTGTPINVGDTVYLYWTPASSVNWMGVGTDNYIYLFNGPSPFVINSVSS